MDMATYAIGDVQGCLASLLALLALITLGIKSFLEWKQERDFARAQHAAPEPENPDSSSAK